LREVALGKDHKDRINGRSDHDAVVPITNAPGHDGSTMSVGYLALTMAALFTGAAFYACFAEQAARLELDDRAFLAEWKTAYKRGFAMQAPLAILDFILGIGAWSLTGRVAFIMGAMLLVANWP
jgi:hypothetical protein